MLLEQKHSINKLVVEVNTNNKNVAFKLKDKLDVFLKDEVFPYVESYFESIESKFETTYVQVPKIEIEVNSTSSRNFDDLKRELQTQIVKEISKTLFEKPADRNNVVSFISEGEYHLKSFLEFIESGTGSGLHLDEDLFELKHLKEITSTRGFTPNFIRSLQKENTQQRIINQFDDEQLIFVLGKVVDEVSYDSNDIVFKRIQNQFLKPSKFKKNIGRLNARERQMAWRFIFNVLLVTTRNKPDTIAEFFLQLRKQASVTKSERTFSTALKTVLSALNIDLKEIGIPEEVTLRKKNNKKGLDTTEDLHPKIEEQEQDQHDFSENDDLTEGIIVQNAGLILLHPYLSQFFRSCSLLNEQDQLTDKVLAAHVLHYLATKEENAYENQMVFEKLLCGIPSGQSINRHESLSDELKREAEELLSAVIKNWGALKNASPDLLRYEFLRRSGKIMLKNNVLKLIVERKTQDILLDKLPWGISYCKLPWLGQLITTDW